MANETKHTPTPWAWIEGDPDIFTHWNNKEVVLATVKHPVWHEDRLCGSMEAAANAAHIVKCVNLHDELVEALDKLFNSYKYLADSGDAGFWKLEDCLEGKLALAALAKARGEV